MSAKNDQNKWVRIEVHFTKKEADKLTSIAEKDRRSRKNYIENLLRQLIEDMEDKK